MPGSVRLQLVSPAKALPVRPGWLYEPKLDGCRILLGKDGDVCQVRTRGGHQVQDSLPEVVESLRRLPVAHAVFDAELVVLDESGHTDFDATCERIRGRHGPPVLAFVFDVLALDGEDLRERPLRERKSVLQSAVRRGHGALRPIHFVEGSPAALVAAVNELGLEGVVSKWSGSRYVGGRTSLWQKLILRRPEKGWRVEETSAWRRR
jgi:bifunctional non-homologous end joining protein LigD